MTRPLFIETPLGKMGALASAKGIVRLEFLDDESEKSNEKLLKGADNATFTHQENEYLCQLKDELNLYFSGNLTQFKVKLDMEGTDFQLRVWNALMEIPFGETISYKEQSTRLGNLKAIRAVASANGSNNIAIVVPCHRVIGYNGNLTGYAGGLYRKKWLLDFEAKVSGKTLF